MLKNFFKLACYFCICITAACYSASLSQSVSTKALQSALHGYQLAMAHHKAISHRYLAIVDFTQPSYQKRMYVYDLRAHQTVLQTLVAQGRGSGVGPYAKRFSNHFNSDMSSLGIFITTGANFASDHGYSIHLKGIQRGINDNASRRTVEIHSAWYVSQAFAKRYHRVGNSLGCFAVNKLALQKLRPLIGDHTVLFAYGDQAS